MKERKIALLVDVDNVKIGKATMDELFRELNNLGSVVYCKFYGYNDRKHIYLSELIMKYGYETAPFMRYKKRFSQLDNRIIVDAVKINYTKPDIDSFCIVAGDGDLIPLLVELKSCAKTLIDINTEYQEQNIHMFDKHINLNFNSEVPQLYMPKATKTAKPSTVTKKVTKTTTQVKPKSAPISTVVEEEYEEYEDYDLSEYLRDITRRYNELDFTNEKDMPKKLRLIADIERLIKEENAKGEGTRSSNPDMRQIFLDLEGVVEDMKNAL